MKLIRVLCYRKKRKAVSQRGGDWWSKVSGETLPDTGGNGYNFTILAAAGRTLSVSFILDFGKTWLEIPLVFSDFSMGFSARFPSAAAAQDISWLEWGRKEIEEDFGERDPASARIRELTHTLSISPHPACCAWVLRFPVESFLFFPLNQSVLGNINPESWQTCPCGKEKMSLQF